MISLVLADDHPLFRKGLRHAVEEDSAMKVIGEAGDGAAALGLIESLKPDVAILDIDMPALRGLQVAKTLSDRELPVGVILLTIYNEQDMFDEAMHVGVRGYVMKETAVLDILSAIRAVSAGQYYFSPAVSGRLVGRSHAAERLRAQRPGLAVLTPAERRILTLIARSKTSKEIAEDLFVSYRTVETHRTNIAMKLGLHGCHSLVKFAIEHRTVL